MAKKQTATAVADPVDVTPVSEDAAEEFKARAEADFDPVETATERLARLTAETKATLAAARKEARAETKAEKQKQFESTVGTKFDAIATLLGEIEQETGQVFRHFSYLYRNPKSAEKPEIKIRHTLVAPRGESTED